MWQVAGEDFRSGHGTIHQLTAKIHDFMQV